MDVDDLDVDIDVDEVILDIDVDDVGPELSCLITSAALSASPYRTDMRWAETWKGSVDASTTRRPLTPYYRQIQSLPYLQAYFSNRHNPPNLCSSSAQSRLGASWIDRLLPTKLPTLPSLSYPGRRPQGQIHR